MIIEFRKDDCCLVNGDNVIQIAPCFKGGLDVLKFFDGCVINKIIKKQSKQTYVDDKNNKVRHYYNYFLEFENGTRIQVKSTYRNVLDGICVYEG